jgi:hypothetical protein
MYIGGIIIEPSFSSKEDISPGINWTLQKRV